jgi:hypothetical protein
LFFYPFILLPARTVADFCGRNVMAESDNIPTKLPDLLVDVIPQLNKSPRDQKFVLGDRIEHKLLAVREDCLRAYHSRDKLLEANLQLEVSRASGAAGQRYETIQQPYS